MTDTFVADATVLRSCWPVQYKTPNLTSDAKLIIKPKDLLNLIKPKDLRNLIKPKDLRNLG